MQTVLQFACEVYLVMNGNRINAKSIMGLLTLVAAWGTEVVVSASGPDAEQAVDALVALVDNGFGEGVADA